MAISITCDMCGGEPAVVMITNLANGDTLAYGDACQLTFYLTVAAELLGNTPVQAAFEYADMVDKLVSSIAAANLSGGGEPAADPAGTAHDISEPPASDEGPTDEHATAVPRQPGDGANGPDTGHDPVHRPARRNTRRPG